MDPRHFALEILQKIPLISTPLFVHAAVFTHVNRPRPSGGRRAPRRVIDNHEPCN